MPIAIVLTIIELDNAFKHVRTQVVICRILEYIQKENNGVFPTDLKFWVNFFEIGTKSASLLIYAATGVQVGLVCDFHVVGALTALNLTTAVSSDEVMYQAEKWIPKEEYLRTNDAIGSIQQIIRRKKKKDSNEPTGYDYLMDCAVRHKAKYPNMVKKLRVLRYSSNRKKKFTTRR